jgi:hypothetical protein
MYALRGTYNCMYSMFFSQIPSLYIYIYINSTWLMRKASRWAVLDGIFF